MTITNIDKPAQTWDTSSPTLKQTFSVVNEESDPSGICFKPDGLQMYVVGFNGDEVNEYVLTTPWDISTATALRTFSVAAQQTTPTGIAFSSDGFYMYITGTTAVSQYTLAIAWNVASAVFTRTQSVSSQETAVRGLYVRSDGVKMYIIGLNGDDVNEYTMTTPWDISTLTFVQVFSVADKDSQPQEVFFKADGSRMYILGLTSVKIYEYLLSTAWDVSTAVFFSSFSLTNATQPGGLFFSADGMRLYTIDFSTDLITEYVLDSFINSARASDSELWSTISPTWATETRTWAECISLIGNTSRPSGSITNIARP